MLVLSCLFFFSSRRRHTRLQGDWSSDVCSSDLSSPRRRSAAARSRRLSASRAPGSTRKSKPERWPIGSGPRSEERRVGKEGRARWAAEPKKKKQGKEAKS